MKGEKEREAPDCRRRKMKCKKGVWGRTHLGDAPGVVDGAGEQDAALAVHHHGLAVVGDGRGRRRDEHGQRDRRRVGDSQRRHGRGEGGEKEREGSEKKTETTREKGRAFRCFPSTGSRSGHRTVGVRRRFTPSLE